MLSYSFDIYQASRASASRKSAALDAPSDDDHDGDMVVVFRDQKTADAVTASPAIIRLFLEETGFGFSTQTGTVPDGYVRANNDDTKRNLKKRIAQALSNQALERALDRVATKSAFDVREFILTIIRGKQAAEPQSKATSAIQESEDVMQMPATPAKRIVPRRPSDLLGRGIKSRLRPQ